MRAAVIERLYLSRTDWALLPLRLVVGVVFFAHGGQKLFFVGIPGTARFMSEVGIPVPTLAAIVVSSAELLGGAAIAIGLRTRWAASILSIDMLVALLLVQVKAGLLKPGGFEFVLTLLAATVTLALHGGGKPSILDRRVSQKRAEFAKMP